MNPDRSCQPPDECPFWDECFNAGEDLLCNDCDRTEATFKLTDPEKIKEAWDKYCDYCDAAIKQAKKEAGQT
jgi:hypothetical protein